MKLNPFETDSGINRKLRSAKNLNFEDVFLDVQNEDATMLDDERDHLNYRILGAVLFLCLAILGGRLLYLQIIRGSTYRALAEGNKLRVQYILAPRGLIEDRTGQIIASNTPSFEVDVTTADLPHDPGEFASELGQVSQVLNQPYDDLLATIKKMNQNSYSAQTLLTDITKDQALILIGQATNLKGYLVENSPIRDYKDSLMFSALIGYPGKITADELSGHLNDNYLLNDYIGKTGIEFQYENYLRGTPGQQQAEIDAQGNFKQTLAEIPPIPGNNVKLNIDYGLQKELYTDLTAEMQKIKAPRGAAVATNPQTGEVLALISLPSFDNNQFAQGISQDQYSALVNNPDIPLLDRAISGTYPPGSTIKPMMAVAALSEGVVTPTTKILDDGVIRVGSFTFYGYEHSGLGIMDIYSAIAKSSDIYFYTVGGGNPKTTVATGLGPDRIAEYLRKFNLGHTLGIDLPSEKPGLVPDPAWKQATKGEQWYLGDTYHESIGQGDVLATPLQVNSWTATIANGGKVMQPYLLDSVTDQNGKVLAAGQPKVLAQNVFDPNVVKIVQDGMRQTVTVGTARSLNTLPIAISGKTGTAQFDARDLTRTHAWFTSYAPSDNPQIALTILIEDGGEGSSVATPVAKQVYAWWAANRYQK